MTPLPPVSESTQEYVPNKGMVNKAVNIPLAKIKGGLPSAPFTEVVTVLPQPQLSLVGKIYFLDNGTNGHDICICKRRANNIYGWEKITTTPI